MDSDNIALPDAEVVTHHTFNVSISILQVVIRHDDQNSVLAVPFRDHDRITT